MSSAANQGLPLICHHCQTKGRQQRQVAAAALISSRSSTLFVQGQQHSVQLTILLLPCRQARSPLSSSREAVNTQSGCQHTCSRLQSTGRCLGPPLGPHLLKFHQHCSLSKPVLACCAPAAPPALQQGVGGCPAAWPQSVAAAAEVIAAEPGSLQRQPPDAPPAAAQGAVGLRTMLSLMLAWQQGLLQSRSLDQASTCGGGPSSALLAASDAPRQQFPQATSQLSHLCSPISKGPQTLGN